MILGGLSRIRFEPRLALGVLQLSDIAGLTKETPNGRAIHQASKEGVVQKNFCKCMSHAALSAGTKAAPRHFSLLAREITDGTTRKLERVSQDW